MNLRHLGWWVLLKKTQNIHTYLHARSCDALPELFFLSSWLIAWSKKKCYSGRRRRTTPHLLASLLQRIFFPSRAKPKPN
jgi:hypothetical protein